MYRIYICIVEYECRMLMDLIKSRKCSMSSGYMNSTGVEIDRITKEGCIDTISKKKE